MLEGVTFEEYQASYQLRRTVERALAIVSEAAKALPEHYRAKYPEAPWSAIVAIGSVLRHDYHRISDARLWEIVTVHLPQLRPVIMQMLTEGGRS
jgi:uncharacterized protein with HEPN domain